MRWGVWPVAILVAGPASAHAPVPGIEGFYTGLIHPFSTPAQSVLMVGTGLLVGGVLRARIPWGLGGFVLFLCLGLLFGTNTSDLDLQMFAVACTACSLAAMVPGRLVGVTILLASLAGGLIGIASIPDDGPMADRLFTMTGSFVGAAVSQLYICAAIYLIRDRYPAAWVLIALRVIAAWVGAVALVMLALQIASSGPSAMS